MNPMSFGKTQKQKQKALEELEKCATSVNFSDLRQMQKQDHDAFCAFLGKPRQCAKVYADDEENLDWPD